MQPFEGFGSDWHENAFTAHACARNWQCKICRKLYAFEHSNDKQPPRQCIFCPCSNFAPRRCKHEMTRSHQDKHITAKSNKGKRITTRASTSKHIPITKSTSLLERAHHGVIQSRQEQDIARAITSPGRMVRPPPKAFEMDE